MIRGRGQQEICIAGGGRTGRGGKGGDRRGRLRVKGGNVLFSCWVLSSKVVRNAEEGR